MMLRINGFPAIFESDLVRGQNPFTVFFIAWYNTIATPVTCSGDIFLETSHLTSLRPNILFSSSQFHVWCCLAFPLVVMFSYSLLLFLLFLSCCPQTFDKDQLSLMTHDNPYPEMSICITIVLRSQTTPLYCPLLYLNSIWSLL